jgi:hypothetical protein
MPTPKKKPPQKTKTPPQRTKKPKQNLTSKPANPTPKKSIKRLSNRKEGQPIPEPILRFFDVKEIPSPLELAKLAVSLAAAENEKPSPERALEFLEETAETIEMTKTHITHYEKKRMSPSHLTFRDGIRYIIRAKGQSRPKREREQFEKLLRGWLKSCAEYEEFSEWREENPEVSSSKFSASPVESPWLEEIFSKKMNYWEKYGFTDMQAEMLRDDNMTIDYFRL